MRQRSTTRNALATAMAVAAFVSCSLAADVVRLPSVSTNIATRSVSEGLDSTHAIPRRRIGLRSHSQQVVPLEPIAQNAAPEPELLENGTEFPELPPPPAAEQLEPLRPLDEELWLHGGSYLYAPEGDRLGLPCPDAFSADACSDEHWQLLRLPEDFCAPQPLTCFTDFLGASPIETYPRLRWPGCDGYMWEPRLVAYGGYQLFAQALEVGDERTDLIGHQLLVDIDFKATSTERIHLQFRPIGQGNSGGSYYQFSDPEGYVDNATGIPERWWFEGEIASMFSGWCDDPFVPRDYVITAGKFPYVLHNSLLLNDDITGVVLSKNNIYLGRLSNLNVQMFVAFDDVDAYEQNTGNLYGMHATADYRRILAEATYAWVEHPTDSGRDAHYIALSATKLFGPRTLAARVFGKFGDSSGRGSGGLFVLESNWTRTWHGGMWGLGVFNKGVYYANAFAATRGWNSISGGNFDRLRTAFAVNPLVGISASTDPDDTAGVALGVQMFGHHDDYFLVPEIAFEAPQGDAAFAFGLDFQIKTGTRSFFTARGIATASDNEELRRNGVFLSETIVF